ncbi:hypothetical protein JOD64_005291 [Micromonospora luteifusca]|uniref:Uncharacterized protein n=1 Tax=Micromonospora luteifusca TaxID=709860 RepID=A0ABS2M0U7_9ACTN|nr:hypothetical protein [Micromonospora luteifusca]MBM7494069.1 hypothetical protein [Micromonospora luteifusca]
MTAELGGVALLAATQTAPVTCSALAWAEGVTRTAGSRPPTPAADPAVVAGWIAETQAKRRRAEAWIRSRRISA